MASPLPISTSRFLQLIAIAGLLLAAATAGAQPVDNGLPKSPLRITGTVKGPAGPAEGVRVLLELRDMRDRRPEYFAEQRTNTEGDFEFDISQFNWPEYGVELITVSPRYIERNRLIRAAKSEFPLQVELEVKPGTIARGTVTDGEGKPLGDVRISGSMVRQQKSGPDGTWEVFGIPPGGNQLTFEKEGYALNFLTVTSQQPEIIEGLEVKMESARELKGRVLNWDDEPVPYALIIFKDKERFLQETADEDGNFTFRGVPDNPEGMYLTALQEGYLPTEHALSPEEAETLEVDLVIDNGVFVEGQVLLPSGKPAAGSTVVAGKVLSRSAAQAETNAEGKWRLGPFPPKFTETFTALPPNTEPSWGVADMTIKDYPRPNTFQGEVELWPKGFSSEFTIQRDGTKVIMTRRDEGPGGHAAQVRYEGELDADKYLVTGKVLVEELLQEGTFEMLARQFVPGSLAGEWELKEEIGPSQLDIAPVQKEITMPMLTGTLRNDLKLAQSLPLSGRALREDGSPFVDGIVEIVGWNDTNVYNPRVEIGVGGRFRFDRVPDGVFRVRAQSDNREHVTPPLFARGGISDLLLQEGEPDEDPMDE